MRIDRGALALVPSDPGQQRYLQQVQRFAAYVAGVEAWARDAVTAKVVTEIRAQLAAEVIMSWHPDTGSVLVQRKRDFKGMCEESAQAHIRRLSEGVSNAMESSSAHLDLISELRWINTQISSIGYDVLPQAEAAGDAGAEILIERAE